MREFFQGWRRKMGCVLLLVAAAFTGGWIRSLSVVDTFGFVNGDPQSPIWIGSVDSTFVLVGRIPVDWTTIPSTLNLWETEPFVPDTELMPEGTQWSYRYFRFGYGFNSFCQFVAIPYWMIVIPLITLSAGLIFWKPQVVPKSSPKD